MMDYRGRRERLRARLAETTAPAVLITGAANVRYLSGFTGSQGALIIDPERALLVSDFRYRLQAAEQAPDYRFVEVSRWVEGLAAAIRDLGAAAIGFEPAHLTYDTHAKLAAALGGVTLMPLQGLVERMREVKDAQELALMRQAAQVSDAAMERVMAMVRPGVSERSLALAAEDHIKREAGAEVAFPPIVACGPRSALCHAEPSERALAPGELVVIDIGARWQGYGADLTRTVAVARAGAREREIYEVCRRAQQAALEAVRAGRGCVELDAAARGVIEQAGYGEAFGHGLGHGVGLEAHEAPRLSRTAEGDLAADMTVTIEPGIYLTGVGGVRVEDLVAVTDDGHQALTRARLETELPVRE